MIGDDLAAALPDLRAQAESMMRDECVVRRPTGEASDDEGRVVTTYADAPVYTGRCKIRARSMGASESAPAGGDTLARSAVEVCVPAGVVESFAPGDVVVVGGEPRYRVIEAMGRTWEVQTRLACERVR